MEVIKEPIISLILLFHWLHFLTIEGIDMEYELMRVREFLSENWSAWEAQCDQNGDDPQEIYDQLNPED